MAVKLNQTMTWNTASGDDAAMLDGLQPNILKGHTREHLTLLFLRFGDQASGRGFLRALSNPASGKPLMKSAKVHLQEVKRFKKDEKALGTPYVGVGLTPHGYATLGFPKAKQPADRLFQAGMAKSSLGDPAVASWEKPFNDTLDAVILVGDADQAPHDEALKAVRQLMATFPKIVEAGVQEGLGLHNDRGEGIEHFGYVDGRSQPLFLAEDVSEETLSGDGATNWNPAFELNRAIVPDPAAPDPTVHCGSYFIYRKLEQNVQLFKTEESLLADRLRLRGDDAERAGAMLVGRFEDGTPLTAQRAEGAHNPVPNDFNYDSDPQGGKCPFFAHIRKVNPRGSGGFKVPESQERLHIMARRGQTYGKREDGPNDGRLTNKPTAEVGLLFMAFNVDIAAQFEFAQKAWANSAGFPEVPGGRTPPGLDMVIGQGARPDIECPLTWGVDFSDADDHTVTTAVPQAVHMKGGAYFFMPSLPFLATL